VRRARELIEQLDAIEDDLWHLWQCYAARGARCISPPHGSEAKVMGKALQCALDRKTKF